MKKILILITRLVYRPTRFARSLLDKALFYLNAIKTYLEGRECETWKDSLLLQRLRKDQPPASDRYIEYPWTIENISISEGRLLDVGSVSSAMFADLLPKSLDIYALDLNSQPIRNPKIKFTQGDIRKAPYQDNYFDCVTCISTLEHIGVAGRYHSDNDPDGDIKAMQEMKRVLKPGGSLILTVPYGIRDVLPINKLYNKTRIDKLLNSFDIKQIIYVKFSTIWGVWLKVPEEEAAKTDMLKDRWYSIALIKANKK